METNDDPKNVIDIRKKKTAPKKLDWKITYEVHRKPQKRFSKNKVLFWIKFSVYILLVSYLLSQCGIVGFPHSY